MEKDTNLEFIKSKLVESVLKNLLDENIITYETFSLAIKNK